MAGVVLRGEAPTGSGDGYGYGYGYGYGDGDGDGYGYGYGYGYGDGYGDGYGYGYGDGDGDGSGYGDGSGDGSGYGYGYGYGDGDGYWLALLPTFSRGWSAAQLARLAELQTQGVRLAYWRSNAEGKPANGGCFDGAAQPGRIDTAPGPLRLCQKNTLHATLNPTKWAGERVWIVALHGDVIGDEEKYGCLKREILGECRLSGRAHDGR